MVFPCLAGVLTVRANLKPQKEMERNHGLHSPGANTWPCSDKPAWAVALPLVPAQGLDALVCQGRSLVCCLGAQMSTLKGTKQQSSRLQTPTSPGIGTAEHPRHNRPRTAPRCASRGPGGCSPVAPAVSQRRAPLPLLQGGYRDGAWLPSAGRGGSVWGYDCPGLLPAVTQFGGGHPVGQRPLLGGSNCVLILRWGK